MKHGNSIRTFGRKKNQRNALMKGLVLSLIKHEKIETTQAKAKELRPVIEKLVTKANVGTIASRRFILAKLYNSATSTNKLIDVIAPKYKSRKGGYTRITKIGQRGGDASPMAIIEFI